MAQSRYLFGWLVVVFLQFALGQICSLIQLTVKQHRNEKDFFIYIFFKPKLGLSCFMWIRQFIY